MWRQRGRERFYAKKINTRRASIIPTEDKNLLLFLNSQITLNTVWTFYDVRSVRHTVVHQHNRCVCAFQWSP